MDSLSRTLGYPYYYFSRDVPKIDGSFFNGVIFIAVIQLLTATKLNFLLADYTPAALLKPALLTKTIPLTLLAPVYN